MPEYSFLLSWVQFPLFADRNFVAFFFTCLPEKIGSPCTNKAFWKKINAHRLPICIPVCAGWVCSTDLQSSLRLYMVPEDTGGNTRQWSSGDPVAAVDDSAPDAAGSTTPGSTDSVAKGVAAPDTTRGAEGSCSPESND